MRRRIKRLLSPGTTVWLRCLLRNLGLPRWGNLRRVKPFSETFGGERGTPVDRPYIEAFFSTHADFITGDVLEIQASGYTRRFGHKVHVAHSVDVNPYFLPTYCCDLAQADTVIPDDYYDCFLLPQTLQHLCDVTPALQNILRVVKPGGVILASAAGLMPLIPDGPDYWRCSAQGWRKLVERAWPGCEILVEGHGNCLVAVAGMMGLAAEELAPKEMSFRDERYPVVTTIFCRKPNNRV